jgi:cytochrome c-type biogenesis protein CcmE
MKPATRRMLSIARRLAALAVAAGLVLNAFREQPGLLLHAVAGRQAARRPGAAGLPHRRHGRDPPALRREADGAGGIVPVTDGAHTSRRRATAASCPTCSARGQGVVAQGTAGGRRQCSRAREVLAKHDENYMPPEAAEALDEGPAARSERQLSSGRLRTLRNDPRARPLCAGAGA